MKQRTTFTIAAAILAGAGCAALADWEPGDGHKMHFPQLPDANGLDVDFETPHFLADDWQCSETGPVTDIHFWASHRAGEIPLLLGLHVEILSNVEAAPGVNLPGVTLWEGDLLPFGEDFDYAFATGGSGDQGWYDPYTGEYIPSDHDSYFQVNLTNISEPFTQQEGEYYWLGISIDTNMADGWKSSLDTFGEGAQYRGLDGQWNDLLYPSGHPMGGESMALAFVITPEPASVVMLLALGALSVRRAR